MESIQTLLKEYWFWIPIGILILGMLLGFTKTIVVYRDFADLTKVFMLVLIPVAILLIAMKFGQGAESKNETVKIIVGILELALVIWISISTYIDNQNIFKTILAILTKIPLGVVFAIYIVQLILPSGKTRSQKNQSRGVAVIIMMVLTPILYGLVRNKVWSYKKPIDNEPKN